MRIELWQRVEDIPRAVVFRAQRVKVVIEFGRTGYLPFQCVQVIRTRALSIWYDPKPGPKRISVDDGPVK